MPFALSLYLHSLYQKKVKKDFDKNNIVLRQKDIEDLLKNEDVHKTLRVFRSAIVDHKKVNETPYYLEYPVNGIGYHSGFKKSVIADGITSYPRALKKEELSDVLLILDKLINPKKSISYVQILAWNSLGRIGEHYSTLIKDKKEMIQAAFSGSVASVLGVLIFLDKMLETTQKRRALYLIKESNGLIKYRVQKSLINYYMLKSPYFGNPIEENPNLESDIKNFLLTVQSNRLMTQRDIDEGLRSIGLINCNQKASFWDNTPHSRVKKLINEAVFDYIAPIGAFSRGEYSYS